MGIVQSASKSFSSWNSGGALQGQEAQPAPPARLQRSWQQHAAAAANCAYSTAGGGCSGGGGGGWSSSACPEDAGQGRGRHCSSAA